MRTVLSTTDVSRVKLFTRRLQRWDVYLRSGFLSPEHVAVRCRHALWAYPPPPPPCASTRKIRKVTVRPGPGA